MDEGTAGSPLESVIDRLKQMASQPHLVSKIPLTELVDPTAAFIGFERWLEATGAAEIQLDAALESPQSLVRLLRVLAASDPMADALVQNPGLASLFFEEAIPVDPFESGWFDHEAKRLLESVTSTSHLLDRLRYLKQKLTLEISARDLGNEAPQPEIWRLLSELANQLIGFAASALWDRFRGEYGLAKDLPLAVIAMGKLGSGELNYSSDIDLVFICHDGLDWDVKKKVERFATHLISAMAESMGRGRLYRVDMRLRPFGGVGEIAPSQTAFERYLANHAEPWEILALTRARSLNIPEQVHWFESDLNTLKRRFCFEREWSEASIGALIEMREALDEFADPGDFKRGAGGIRDVEFITQVYQLLLGAKQKEIVDQPTLAILTTLESLHVLTSNKVKNLNKNYIFLRKLEHRCQILGDQQTHCLPEKVENRAKVAALMGFPNASELESHLSQVLASNRKEYHNQLQGWVPSNEVQAVVPLLEEVERWLGRFPLSQSFFESVQSNDEAVHSLNKLAEFGPQVVVAASDSLSLTEAILGAESFAGQTEDELKKVFQQIPNDESQNERLGSILRDLSWGLASEWVQEQDFLLSAQLLRLAKLYIGSLCARVGLDEIEGLSVLLLGAYAREEASIESDLDLFFLLDSAGGQAEAEGKVQRLLRLSEEAVRFGSPFAIDLRLRPEGKQGLMVRTIEGLRNYGRSEMEMWERFALGQGLPVHQTENGSYLMYEIGYGLPLTPHRLEELLAIKKRIEVERVSDDAQFRDVKLGRGSLGDIEWLVHLLEMRYPLATHAGESPTMEGRIERLGKAGLLHVGEVDELKEGHQFLVKMKIWLNLQLGKTSVRPENPDKLLRLAKAMGFEEGNQLLDAHLGRAKRIRQMFEESVLRLQGRPSR